jgi:hypothetical protein
MRRLKLQQIAIGVVLAIACMVLAANIFTANQAHGEVRGTPEPQSFQAGSVPVLREISATLHQIDARLSRLETVAQKLRATAATRPSTANVEENNQ